MTVRTITAVVERLADDVRRTLGLPPQEPLDKSFAGLGGSSMEAAQLTVRLRRARGLAIGARELLNAADVQRLLDELVIRPRAEPAEHPVDAAPTGRAPLTWQQRVVWYQSVLDPGSSRHVFHALFHFAEAPVRPPCAGNCAGCCVVTPFCAPGSSSTTATRGRWCRPPTSPTPRST